MTQVSTLIERLQNGVVEFEYKKADGSTRRARGTLNAAHVPAGQTIPQTTALTETVSYWDIESNGWRAFKSANVIGVTEAA